MSTILISIDQTANVEMLAKFPQRIASVSARAINLALSSGQTVMVKLVAKETGFTSQSVRDKMKIWKANVNRLEGLLIADETRIPLIKFRASGPEPSRGRGNGVSWQLAGSRHGNRHPHAFIATMPGGHRGVFVRDGKGRLPIRELPGPSIGAVFAKHKDKGVARVEARLHEELDHQFALAGQNLDVTPPSDGDVDAE